MSVVLRCKEHPKYQAKRKPTADCDKCRKMWAISEHNQK